MLERSSTMVRISDELALQISRAPLVLREDPRPIVPMDSRLSRMLQSQPLLSEQVSGSDAVLQRTPHSRMWGRSSSIRPSSPESHATRSSPTSPSSMVSRSIRQQPRTILSQMAMWPGIVLLYDCSKMISRVSLVMISPHSHK